MIYLCVDLRAQEIQADIVNGPEIPLVTLIEIQQRVGIYREQ